MSYTPDSIVQAVMTGLATHNFEGISAAEFWPFVAQQQNAQQPLDEFMKKVVWAWLLQEEDFHVLRVDEEATKKSRKKDVIGKVIVDKAEIPSFHTLFEEGVTDISSQYTIKVSDDFQSIYLVGVPQKENVIPRFPYQLILYIAKHKEEGINSVDLIKESGQDNRSLTKRLAVLEENLLIQKKSVCANKSNTHHMTHFRFVKIDKNEGENNKNNDDDASISNADVNSGDTSAKTNSDGSQTIYRDKLMMMVDIMNKVKEGTNQIRLTKDLFLDFKSCFPTLRLKWFTKILHFLVKYGALKLIQIQHPEVKRFFPAVQFIKDLPPVGKLAELVKMAKMNDSKNGDLDEEDVEDEDDENDADDTQMMNVDGSTSIMQIQGRTRPSKQAKFNRFFPIQNQVRDLIEQYPGSRLVDVDSNLTGLSHLRQISNILENYSSNTPTPDQPGSIIGQLVHAGRIKYFRYNLQDHLNKMNPDYDTSNDVEREVPQPLKSQLSLFEESISYGSKNSSRRKVRCASLWSDKEKRDKYLLIARGYNGPAGLAAVSDVPITSVLQGSYQTSNGWIKADVKRGKLSKIQKKVSEYEKEYNFRLKNLESYNLQVDEDNNELMATIGDEDLISSAALMEDSQDTNLFMQTPFLADGDNGTVFEDGIIPNLEMDISHTQKDSSQRSVVETSNLSSTLPSQPLDLGPGYRREKLLEILDERRCICVNNIFIQEFSKILNGGYMVARRTLIADSMILERKGFGVCEKFKNGKFVLKSLKNPPSEEDVNKSIIDPAKTFKPRATLDSVNVEKVTVNNSASLTKGRKFATREEKLNHLMNKLKRKPEEGGEEDIGNGRRRRRRAPRKAKEAAVGAIGAVTSTETPEERRDDDEDEEGMVNAYGEEEEDSDGEGDEEDEEMDDDLLEPLMDDRTRKKLKNQRKNKSRVTKTFKKVRSNIDMSNSDMILMIKAIIVTQSLSISGNVDWPKVMLIFGDKYDPTLFKRLWPRYRKMLGVKNLSTAKRNFETALMDSIRNGNLKGDELEDYDIFKIVDLWKSFDTDIFIEKIDYEINKKYEENFREYTFKSLKGDDGFDLFKEALTMIEKEQIWTSRNFMYCKDDHEKIRLREEMKNPTSLQIAKTKLKALFATGKDKFDSMKVKELFEGIPKEMYAKALTELEDMKAIAFLGEDSKIKFTLTDRLILKLECKMDDKFVEGSKRMKEVIMDVDKENGALMLSTRSPNGGYAPLLSMISNDAVSITRVDRKLDDRDSYYTKALDRSKFEADFLISHVLKDKVYDAKQVSVPIGGACSKLWIDLCGDFNGVLWRKCVYVVIWGVMMHPGVTDDVICEKMMPLLEPFEVAAILEWLRARGNVREEKGGYWPTPCWYDV